MTYASIERTWVGETVVCLGTGPSLTQTDVDFCRGKARVIAVNNAYRVAPWADLMYACDAKFWNWEKGAPDFTGRKYALQEPAAKWPGVQILKNLGQRGISTDPSGVMTGHNSVYQAINIAVLAGAARIVLLGVDMRGDHYFGSHPDKSKPAFALCLEAFPSLIHPLREAGIAIVNCTPKSALTCFPMGTLQDALIRRAA